MSIAQAVNPLTDTKLVQRCINTIRTLSIDAVQQAKSGHPGTPMALAPLIYTIWNRILRFDPQDPISPKRDRFVLSNGHASMLLWSALHLTRTRAVNADYETLGQQSVTLDDISGSGSSPARRPVTRNTIGCPASRPRPVRWDKESPQALAWRWRRSGWPANTTGRASRSSTTTFMPFVVMPA